MQRQRKSQVKRNFCLLAEPLERRMLLAAVNWVGGAAGNWNTPANWSGGSVPTAADDVTIDAPAIVTLDAGNHSINTLNSSGKVVMTGGTLTIDEGGLFTGGGTPDAGFELQAGTLTASVVNPSALAFVAGSPFTMSGGILKGNISISAFGGLFWTGGEMASPGTTIAELSSYPFSSIGGSSQPVRLSRELRWRGRDLLVQGNVEFHNGTLLFDSNGRNLRCFDGALLDGGGTNLLQIAQGELGVEGNSNFTIQVPSDIAAGSMSPASSLHLLGGGTGSFGIADGANLNIEGNGFDFDQLGSSLNNRGNVYFWSGSSTVANVSSFDTLTVRQGASVRFDSDLEVNVAAEVRDTGSLLELGGSLSKFGSIVIASDGEVKLSGSGANVMRTGPMFLTSGAEMDLGRESLILDYEEAESSPLAAIRSLVGAGYNGGLWNGGIGFNSSHAAANPGAAVGYAEASALFNTFPATFAGQEVDNTTILLTQTLYGDADLNRTVNLADFNRLAGNFGAATGALWSQGNFNFDEAVNLADFNRLAGRFGQSADSGDEQDLTELA